MRECREQIGKLKAEDDVLRLAHKKLQKEARLRGEVIPRYRQPPNIAYELAQLRGKIYYIENAEERKEKARTYRKQGKTTIEGKA